MAKRINKDIKDVAFQELNKKKLVKTKIAGEEYQIRIKYKLTSQDKIDILQDMSELFSALVEEGIDETVVLTVSTIKILTDIEFPEDAMEQISFLVLLTDLGIVELVLTETPKGVIEDLVESLQASSEIVSDLLEKEFLKQDEIEKALEGKID